MKPGKCPATCMRCNVCKVAITLGLVAAWTSAYGQNGVGLDETAHFLAGLPVNGKLAPLMQTAAWQSPLYVTR